MEKSIHLNTRMREAIIHPRLRRSLGSAFEELSEKIVAYNPDVVCPVLRAGRYVLQGDFILVV